jgi:5-methylcytosine-specific restriction endonuclease McrA
VTQAQSKNPQVPEEIVQHWAEQLPYRALVHIRSNGTIPLFAVAGVAGGPWAAEKALKESHKKYRACCFYCRTDSKPGTLTIDHVDPQLQGRRGELANLVLACRSCNQHKGCRPVEEVDPNLGRNWLAAVLKQTQERLNRLP